MASSTQFPKNAYFGGKINVRFHFPVVVVIASATCERHMESEREVSPNIGDKCTMYNCDCEILIQIHNDE